MRSSQGPDGVKKRGKAVRWLSSRRLFEIIQMQICGSSWTFNLESYTLKKFWGEMVRAVRVMGLSTFYTSTL